MSETNGTQSRNGFPESMFSANAEHVLRQQVAALTELLVNDTFTLRRDLYSRTLDPRRNLNHECGYPDPRAAIHAQDYQDLYDREPIAARVVGFMPSECWQVSPNVYEDEDPEVVTAFEEAWDNLGSQLRGEQSHYREEEGSCIWDYLRRADELSRIGHYGIVLLGLDDRLDLAQPARGVQEEGSISAEVELQDDEAESAIRPESKFPVKVPARNERGAVVVNFRGGTPNGQYPPYRLTTNFQAFTTVPPAQHWAGTGGVWYQPAQKPQTQQGPDSKPKGKNKLTYLRVFPETQAQVTAWESNPHSPRYGQPTAYLVTFADPRESAGGMGFPLGSRQVHWTRVVHIADTHHQSSSSEVIAVPGMRPTLNPILDCQKIRAASGEGFWKMGVPGLGFETHPQLGPAVRVDVTKARAQIEEWWNGLQRLLIGEGGAFKTLAPAVADPTPFLDVHVQHICIQNGWPKRIFEGSERGELASSQDERAHKERVRGRQKGYLTPRVIVPFIDRLILLGCLPAPAKKGGKLSVKEQPPEKIIAPAEGDSPEPTSPREGATDGPSFKPETPARKPPFARNAFPPKPEEDEADEAQPRRPFVPGDAGEGEETPGEVGAAGKGLGKGGAGIDPEDSGEVDTAPGGYCVEWPDVSSQSDKEQADTAALNTTTLGAYIQANGASLVPESVFLTHPKFLGMDEEEAAQMLEEAAKLEEERLAEEQLQAEEFGFQPAAPEGFMDPEQADRELEMGKAKLEVDKERAKAGLPGGGGMPPLSGGRPPEKGKPNPFGK